MRSLFKKNRFLFAFVTLIVFATNVNLGPAAQARELRRVQEEAILLLFKQAVTEVNSLESISSLIDKLPLHLRDYAREVFYRSFPANHATQIIPEAKEWVQPVYKEILEKAGSFLLGPLGYSVAQKGYWHVIKPAQKIVTDQLKPVSELLLPP
ncbi:MAG: hypothetical protein HY391_00885, partial [Deltaproteobacteria bacterium]|nr:hypothetical protein [Deltaproteobacteria bacterium]